MQEGPAQEEQLLFLPGGVGSFGDDGMDGMGASPFFGSPLRPPPSARSDAKPPPADEDRHTGDLDRDGDLASSRSGKKKGRKPMGRISIDPDEGEVVAGAHKKLNVKKKPSRRHGRKSRPEHDAPRSRGEGRARRRPSSPPDKGRPRGRRRPRETSSAMQTLEAQNGKLVEHLLWLKGVYDEVFERYKSEFDPEDARLLERAARRSEEFLAETETFEEDATPLYCGVPVPAHQYEMQKMHEKVSSEMSEKERDTLFYGYWLRWKKINSMIQKSDRRDQIVAPPKRVLSVRGLEKRIICDAKRADRFIRRIVYPGGSSRRGAKHVGIDTEYDSMKPINRKQHAWTLFPDLIQIAVGKPIEVLLFHTKEGSTAPPKELKRLLVDKKVEKAFCNVLADMSKISAWFLRHGDDTFILEDSDESDGEKKVQIYEDRFSLVELDPNFRGLLLLCREYLHVDLSVAPKVTMSRWSASRYQRGMFVHAMEDAVCSLKLLRMGVPGLEREKKRKAAEAAKAAEEEEDADADDKDCETVYRASESEVVALDVEQAEDEEEEEEEGEEAGIVLES